MVFEGYVAMSKGEFATNKAIGGAVDIYATKEDLYIDHPNAIHCEKIYYTEQDLDDEDGFAEYIGIN